MPAGRSRRNPPVPERSWVWCNPFGEDSALHAAGAWLARHGYPVEAIRHMLEADLGSHRKIGTFRLLRPILVATAIVPLFLDKPATHGGGLAVELAGAAAGAAGGLIALVLMRVYFSTLTGKPVSAAAAGYALFWTGVIGARALFSYGASHWFASQLGGWLAASSIPVAAITDGLIFMAVAMILIGKHLQDLSEYARPVGCGPRGSRPGHSQTYGGQGLAGADGASNRSSWLTVTIRPHLATASESAELCTLRQFPCLEVKQLRRARGRPHVQPLPPSESLTLDKRQPFVFGEVCEVLDVECRER